MTIYIKINRTSVGTGLERDQKDPKRSNPLKLRESCDIKTTESKSYQSDRNARCRLDVTPHDKPS